MLAQAGRVILLTCPTDRVRRPEQQEGRKVIATRNQLLRDMVSSWLGGSAPPRRGGKARPGPPPLSLVDVDALTQHLPPGLDVAPTDYHYREQGLGGGMQAGEQRWIRWMQLVRSVVKHS